MFYGFDDEIYLTCFYNWSRPDMNHVTGRGLAIKGVSNTVLIINRSQGINFTVTFFKVLKLLVSPHKNKMNSLIIISLAAVCFLAQLSFSEVRTILASYFSLLFLTDLCLN